MENYKFSEAQLQDIGIYELRTLARDCGVSSPTSKKKDELIAEIIAIRSGKLDPVKKTRRGRPVMHGLSGEGDNANYEFERTYPEIEFKQHFLSERTGGLIVDYTEPVSERQDGACAGVFDLQSEGCGILRTFNYEPSGGDVYVSPQQISRFALRQGDLVEGSQRAQNDRAYAELCSIERVNGIDVHNDTTRRGAFDGFEAAYPTERYTLERKGAQEGAQAQGARAAQGAAAQKTAAQEAAAQAQSGAQKAIQSAAQAQAATQAKQANISLRLIDLLSPIGKGQRTLIAAPSGAGKTTLLKNIAQSISLNNPEAHLMTLLVDVRPEEAADLTKSLKGEIINSAFARLAEEHIKTAELVLSRAKRLVELGRDVVLLLDSLTALCRAYNSSFVKPSSGKPYGGALDPSALVGAKKFFGTARNIESGGSLTIIASVIVGDIADNAIFEEFKQAANAIILLRAKEGEPFVVDTNKSGTRNGELLLTKKELDDARALRSLDCENCGKGGGANDGGSDGNKGGEVKADKNGNYKGDGKAKVDKNGGKRGGEVKGKR